MDKNKANENSDDEELNNPTDSVEVIEIDHNEPEAARLAGDLGDVGMDDEYDDVEDEEEGEERGEINDNSIITIEKHEGSVFCVDHFKNYVATGGEDDLMYLWQIDEANGQTQLYFKSEKYQDSVTQLKFSNDGKYVAATDLAGNIRVFDVQSKTLYWSYELGSDVETLLWHPGCNVLFVGTVDGNFCMFKLSTNEVKMMFCGDDSTKVNCAQILNDGKRAVCAYSNGSVIIWDLKTSQMAHNLKNIQSTEILCMSINNDNNLLAVAGCDMKISVININNGKITNEFKCEGKSFDENSIETIGFCKQMPLVACATINGEIFIWDIDKCVLRHKITDQYKYGFTKLLWNNEYNLYLSSIDGIIYEFDGRNMNLLNKYEGHKANILDFCFSKDFKYLLTASDDNTTKIFSLNK